MLSSLALIVLGAGSGVAGLLTLDTTTDRQAAAGAIAKNLMSYYNTADVGVVPVPSNWWQSAELWDTMLQYGRLTGDESYSSLVSAGLLAQAGNANDFMGPNTMGNDDQLWWGIASMTAAEYSLAEPSSDVSWLQLATNVFNEVSTRWDTTSCGGGMRWQISPSSAGYTYKSAIANGLFFQLAARLARYTSDETYTDWAIKSFDWVVSVGLVDGKTFQVYDGTDASQGCTSLDHDEWSYNTGVYTYGAAVMLDITGDTTTWKPRLDGLIGAAEKTFTKDNVIFEQACEPTGKCNTDQLSFKSDLSRWLSLTMALSPGTAAQISPVLEASANGAVASCNAGPGGNTCGITWTSDEYDGSTGMGQQMSALAVVQGLLGEGSSLPGRASRQRRAVPFVA